MISKSSHIIQINLNCYYESLYYNIKHCIMKHGRSLCDTRHFVSDKHNLVSYVYNSATCWQK